MLDEAGRVLGRQRTCKGGTGERAPGRLNRTLAFANTIKRSEWYAETLTNELVKARTTREIRREHGRNEASTSIDTVHLDASSSAGERKFELDRLRDAGGPGRETDCRIICNCRLFSEGVDVPNLTSVAFLDGKKSQIDVVQAVGRVMRRAEGKDLGYVVVPVVVEEYQPSAPQLPHLSLNPAMAHPPCPAPRPPS